MKKEKPPWLWTDWQTSQSNIQASNDIWNNPPDIFTETLKKAAKTDAPLTKRERRLIGMNR